MESGDLVLEVWHWAHDRGLAFGNVPLGVFALQHASTEKLLRGAPKLWTERTRDFWVCIMACGAVGLIDRLASVPQGWDGVLF